MVGMIGEDEEHALMAALWRVIARSGWGGLTLAQLAAEAHLPLANLRLRFASRGEVLALYSRFLDRTVLAGTVPDQGASARDRLFDVLMRRLDAMQPHRAGIVRLLGEVRSDIKLGLLLIRQIVSSMQWMAEAAGLPVEGCRRPALAIGLAAVWLATLHTWAEDTSEDLGPTMAALDRALARAERLGLELGILGRDAAVSSSAAAP